MRKFERLLELVGLETFVQLYRDLKGTIFDSESEITDAEEANKFIAVMDEMAYTVYGMEDAEEVEIEYEAGNLVEG